MRRRLLAIAALLPLAAGAGAQQKPPQAPPVFRAGIDLVQIDVVVLDAQGRPVRGLTKDDFTLLDRGAPQEIATFAAKTHERPAPDPFPAPLPADVADNQGAKSDRLVILILDDLHFRGRTAEAVGLVRRTVEELGDSVSLGLVTTSGTFGVEVTEDRARLLTAVEHFLDRFDPARAKIPQVTVGPPGFAPPAGTPMEPGTVINIRYSGRDLASDYSPLNTLKTVEDVARMAGANDGRRKAFVWISAGIEGTDHGNATFVDTCKNLKPPASATDHVSMRTCAMFEKLFRSSVAVYSVSPGGPTYGASGRSLGDITRETGGFSIRASDMDAGMTRLITDLDNYYLLGFYPAEPGRTGYRPIDVRVNRPGLTVRHRAGYHAAGPVPPPRNQSPLGALVAPISPKSDLHLRMSAIPFFTSGSSMQLLTTIEVDLSALPEAAADGLVRDELQFAVFAVDLQKKKVTRSVGRRVVVDWPAEHRATPGAERFLVQTVLTVPPGAYQIRASATSRTPETSGSVYLQVDVPPTGDRPLGLSGVVVGTAAASAPRVVESKPLSGVAVPFSPSLDREFPAGDDLRVFFQVRRKNVRTAVQGAVTLVDPGGAEVARVPWSLESSAPGGVALRLPLAGIAPGPYRLVVSATGGQDVAATREVRIRIR
jgi:VWFA-related protein